MFNLNFKDKYRVVHINNELGNCVVGGAGTYMNEIYKYRPEDMGFVYVNFDDVYNDMYASDFMDQKDILIMNINEINKLSTIDCDLLVVQFYEFAPYITEEFLRDKNMAYVIHSVPTPEPMPSWDPFGGNNDIRQKFEKLCCMADVLVCVSQAEKDKLINIYPQMKDKTTVVYNGMQCEKNIKNYNYTTSRKKFGFIGRTDYRKGILECIKEFANLDGELLIACPKNDSEYIEKLLIYIRAVGIEDKIKFVGWCTGDRKEEFFKSIDALIIPSLYEPFGYVALEGMQYGVPLISSRNGGLGEILEGYKYTYDPYKAGELRTRINEFINDDKEEVTKQQEILLKRIDEFTVTKMVNSYNELWDKILKENKNDSK